MAALRALANGRDNVLILKDDANVVITDLCRSTTWRGKHAPGSGIRAVMFLDPYGMSVDYATLKEIRETAAIDLWYLFPLSGLYRQAAHSKANISLEKEAAITRILGTDEWKTRFYAAAEYDLFGNVTEGSRIADVDAIKSMSANGWGPYFLMRSNHYGYVGKACRSSLSSLRSPIRIERPGG